MALSVRRSGDAECDYQVELYFEHTLHTITDLGCAFTDDHAPPLVQVPQQQPVVLQQQLGRPVKPAPTVLSTTVGLKNSRYDQKASSSLQSSTFQCTHKQHAM